MPPIYYEISFHFLRQSYYDFYISSIYFAVKFYFSTIFSNCPKSRHSVLSIFYRKPGEQRPAERFYALGRISHEMKNAAWQMPHRTVVLFSFL
jgi:hypothetical protein